MNKIVTILALLVAGFGSMNVLAEEKPATPSTPSTAPSTEIQNQNTDPALMMKIQQEEPTDEVRRKALIEELRKLYKANFL